MAQYQHYIPQFLLRNFSHPYNPPKKEGSKKRGSFRAEKGKRRGEKVLNVVDLTSDEPQLLESPVPRWFGQEDMYKDVADLIESKKDVEQELSKLESRTAVILQKVKKAHEDSEAKIWLTRVERNILRKFLFIMKYRGPGFFEKYSSKDLKTYESEDKHLLRDYMAAKGMTRPRDVWLHNLRTILDLDMDAEGNWITKLPELMFPADAGMFIFQTQASYMAFCTPAEIHDEFILTDQCYNLFEGPTNDTFCARTGKYLGNTYMCYHDFGPVSPKLIIVLRSWVLPEPLEDMNPEYQTIRQRIHNAAVAQFPNPDNINFILSDLPVAKADNSYTHVVNGRRELALGASGIPRHKFKHQFTQAAKEEFEALKRKGTFEFVPKPQDKQILPLTWVFKYKFDKYGKLTTFKARICVRGDLQQPNDLEKRAATLAARNFRMMMAIAAIFDLEIVQYDAMNAFVNSILDEEVYTYFPDGFKQDGQVIKLRRALYGLRRSPRLWQKELTATLLNLGFTQIPDEECLFIKNGVVLLFYVDDILLFYDKATKQATFKEIEKGLMRKYELRKMKKFEWFLNIRITRDCAQRKIWLCQDSQITKMASKFGINATNNVKTPISGNIEASTEQATNEEIHAYQELVESALYVAVMTRVDVAKAVNELAKHTKNPSKAHFLQIRRVIQYLYNTRSLAIEYSPPENANMDAFVCASDASFGDNPDRTSSEGYLVQLYGGPIDWRATKQRLVTTSTTEAELRAATEAAKRLQVWKRVFRSIGFKPDRELSIQCDNK
ncbi:conserved hypothetical protein [Talaromyces stipitatus ATCC 10500]|uniref:Reverse transcriptase Ty1/copia-type domain-containing protein n=1 Tax=Talaromyces stipitatus (strain ATCC 10500 / CBS 375.48 / QM 6759 / NRRL 1006) TaxID=441959 RepID=B8LX39_TALSN|nr:uncharacterized protein TSTA_061770 [Talaromyces stipitatus ATCC 10500]EED22689.1 conserved hypothetical protein [Talaromyces stipitatus ATCC 10500]